MSTIVSGVSSADVPASTTAPEPVVGPGGDARDRGRARRLVARVAVLFGLALPALAPGGASADLIRFGFDESNDAMTRPVLVRPDGTELGLSPFPEGAESAGLAGIPSVDPGRRFVARIVGTRVAVLPLDGTPTRILRTPGVRADEGASTWWSADGSVLHAGPVRTADGAAAVRRCTVPAFACTVVRTGRWVAVGGAPGGDTLLTRDGVRGTPGRIARDTDGEWHPRGPAWVRRTRALLARPLSDALLLDRGDGTPARTLWRSTRSLAAGSTTIYPVAPLGETSGALLQWEDSRVALTVRRRRGVLSARLRQTRSYDAGYWQVRRDGRLRSLDRLASTPVAPTFPTPDGDWAAVLRPLTAYGDSRLGVVSPGGTQRSLTVGARRVTWRNLHTALGLPLATRPPEPDPDFGPDQRRWAPVGVEASTRSVVVLTEDRRGAVILARVSLDGGRPTVASLRPDLDFAELLVW